MRRIKIDRLKTLAIPDHRVARIEPNDGPAGRIEFQNCSQIRSQVRAAGNASIRSRESKSRIKRGAGLVKENVADAKKTRTSFGKDTHLMKAFAQLDAELALKRAALAQKLKNILIRKEVQFRVDGNSFGEIIGEAAAESRFSYIRRLKTFARGRKQSKRSELCARFNPFCGRLA